MMSSIDMEMDDIFEEQGENDLEEDQANQPTGLPDLDLSIPDMSQTQPGQTQDNAEVVEQLRGAAKKKIMKPQPKLDALRLKGERGLPILPKVFEKINFKGRGHEAEDLKLMMSKLEHWAHRLFPKLPFDDFIEKLEKLGSKKEVQTCIKRIRLDMPIIDEDFSRPGVEDAPQDEEEDEEHQPEQTQTAEDLFDELLEQERDVFDDVMSREANQTEAISSPVHDRTAPNISTPVVKTPLKTPATPGSLNEDQKQRMERNKRMALEKRAKRLGISVEALQQQLTPKPQAKPEAEQSTRLSQDDSKENMSQDDLKEIDSKQNMSTSDSEQNMAEYNKKQNSSPSQNETTVSETVDTKSEEFVLANPTRNSDSDVPTLALDISEENNDMQTEEQLLNMLDDDNEADKENTETETMMETDSVDNIDTDKNTCNNVANVMDIGDTESDSFDDKENKASEIERVTSKNNAYKDNTEEQMCDTLAESQSLSILS